MVFIQYGVSMNTYIIVIKTEESEEVNMKTMIAFGVPPSGEKFQILRKAIMPDGEKSAVIAQYINYIEMIIRARNVRVIVREVF